MSRRKPLAVLAVLAAALAIAIPVASAGAATSSVATKTAVTRTATIARTAPAARQAQFGPGFICVLLAGSRARAILSGNLILAGLLRRTMMILGCPVTAAGAAR